MGSDKKDSSKQEDQFIDKFDKDQFKLNYTHPLFRTPEESRKLGYNKEPLKFDEPATNEYKDPMSGYESF